MGLSSEAFHRYKCPVDKGGVEALLDHNGLTSDEKARFKALERENRELRQANEMLKQASAYFAQAELDRPHWR